MVRTVDSTVQVDIGDIDYLPGHKQSSSVLGQKLNFHILLSMMSVNFLVVCCFSKDEERWMNLSHVAITRLDESEAISVPVRNQVQVTDIDL